MGLLAGEVFDQGGGVAAEVVEGFMAFGFGGLRWRADDAGGRVGVDAEGGEVAAVVGRVVAGLPSVAQVVRQAASRMEVSSSPAAC